MIRTFKYKIRMNRVFLASCNQTLDCCRDLYNAALSQRISYFRQGSRIGFAQQSKQLTEARQLPELQLVSRSFQESALKRLDGAYKAFFRRVKARKGNAGLPRFKSRERYDSFNTREAEAFRLKGDKLFVQKVGSCRVRLSRPLEGRPRTLTIRREFDGWYAVIGCDNVTRKPLPTSGKAVGIDVGLESLATLSTGETVENPRWFREGERRIAMAQQRLALKTRGSQSRRRARRLVAKAHAKARRQRNWFYWQQARTLVGRFDVIAVEKLNVKGLARTRLAKSVSDAGWAGFVQKLSVKAEEAGRLLVRVNAKFTSQDCSGCGKRAKKALAERWHSCECGVSMSRDLNAALNVLARAGPDLKIEPIRSYSNGS